MQKNVATDVKYLPFGPETGWTYGNGLALKVEGESFPAAVRLPFTARRIGAEAA